MHRTCLKIIKIISLVSLTICISSLAVVDRTITFEVIAESSTVELNKPELVTQTGHSQRVNAVVFDPNNQWIATGSTDNTVKIWEASTGRELRALLGHKGPIRALAGSQDGRFLASGSNDRTVKIWEVKSGKELLTLPGHSESVEALSFSTDGRFLASGSQDKSIIIWDAAAGRQISKLPESAGVITSLTFNPNGTYLASGSSDQMVKIWDIAKGSEVKTLKSTGTVTVLQFSLNGEQLAGGSTDSTIKIWKTTNWREIVALPGNSSKVLTLLFLDNGQLMSGSEDRTIKFWDLEKRREIKSVPVKTGNTDKIQFSTISKDGRLLALGNGDRTTAIFDTSNGEKLKAFENRTFGNYCVAFSSDGNWLAAGSLDNTIKLWDLKTGQGLPPLAGHSGDITAIVFHPDNKRLISSGMDGKIRIWDIVGGGAPQILTQQPKYISTIAVSKNGRFIVSGGSDQTVKLWDLETRSEIYTFNGHTGEVTSVSFSPDDSIIASGSADKTIKLWDVATKKLLKTLDGHAEGVASVVFSPNGQLIASGGVDKTVKVWEISTGQVVHTFSEHDGKVNALSFSPDGAYLASGSHDKTVRIWNVTLKRKEKVITSHAEAVYALSFSSDGKWLASGSADGSVIISRKDTGESLATLISLRESNDWLVVTPQGFFDGTPKSWDQLIWRFENNTFNFKPVEVFFKEFYDPGLLAELLRGKLLPKAIDITKKDRRQPRLKIDRVDSPMSADPVSEPYAKVKIEVIQSPADNDYQKGSGARDVRIFRNGSLVKRWSGDVLAGKGDKVQLEINVPLVYGQNQLTAYAFNNDNIKSSDAALNINGSESLKRKGILYIIGIAVSEYSNSKFNLKYIDLDAKDFAEQLNSKQSELSQFESIEIVPLLNKFATKKNILTALKSLTRTGVEKSSGIPPELAKLRTAKPEDTVVVYFTGHGKKQGNHFYMLPHDLGFTDPALSITSERMEMVLKRSISDSELQEVFEDIDANRLLLVIDACNSGQALEAEEARQGPMNTKGLAQLAFDKGMFILTASQSEEEAYVSGYLKRSYLTYALVEDGLKSRKADVSPSDGELSLKEWFDYAVTSVPQIRQKVYETVLQNERKKGIEEAGVVSNLMEKKTAPKPQSPRAFYRRQMDLQPMVIAKLGLESK